MREIVVQPTLLHALEHLLGLLVLNQRVGERNNSADGAVDNHGIDLNLGDTGSGSLVQALQDLGGDLLLYRIGESGLVLLILLVLLGLGNTVLLGTLLLLLSALLVLLDLIFAHFVGFELETGGENELSGLNGWCVSREIRLEIIS